MKKQKNIKADGIDNSSEIESKVQRQKSKVAASVLQYNHIIVRLMNQVSDGLKAIAGFSVEMDGQRELQMRMAMTARAMNSTLRLLSQGKLQLWMIDEQAISDKVREEEK